MIVSGGVVACKCGNAARYMNERGELCCAICPLKEGIDSIKLDDVPRLLAWARNLIDFCQQDNIEIPKLTYRLLGELIDIVQRKPSRGPLIVKIPTLLSMVNDQLPPTSTQPPTVPDWWGKCKCHRPGWLEGHDDPNCEYREQRA